MRGGLVGAAGKRDAALPGARLQVRAVSGVAASTVAPTIGAICSRVFDRRRRSAPAWRVRGAGGWRCGVAPGGDCRGRRAAAERLADGAGGVMAEGSRTSLALVQAASASAASNDTVVTCDRLICPENSLAMNAARVDQPLWIHCTIKSRSWRESGFGCDSVVR